jgi:hypothetical protein
MSISVSQTEEQVEKVMPLDRDYLHIRHQVLTENNNSDEVLNNSLDKPVFEGDVEDGILDFDQDFMDDAYGDLMCHLNSKEFVDFDSIFAKKDENDIELLTTIGEFPVPEELEEGEIQE